MYNFSFSSFMAKGTLALFACLLCASTAFAERGVFTPTIMVQTAYDDNLHFDKKSDWEFRTTPGFEAEYGQETWQVKGGAEAALFRYADLDVYDRENYNFWLGGEYDVHERLKLSLDGSFKYDHTFVDELTQSGTVTGQSLRRLYSLTPGATWIVTEKDSLSVQLPFNAIRYAGRDNSDSTSKGTVLGWSHALNDERTTLIGQGTYTNHYYRRLDGKTKQDVFTVMGGFSYSLTELTNIRILAGAGYADSNVTFNTLSDENSEEAYFNFDLSGTYSKERWTFTLGADRQVSPSTYGESTLRTRGRISGQYSLTERLSTYCEAVYYETETGGLISEDKDRTYYFRPWVKYAWTEDADIRLEFKHTNTKDLNTNREQRQNRIALRFDYSYPSFF